VNASALTICDVGPRDGLQNDKVTLRPEVRAELVDRLVAAGVRRVEVGSFVHPKRVPQMAGVEELCALLRPRPGVSYAGLVLNERGYDRLLETQLDEVHYVVAASESFSARNQGTTVRDAMRLAEKLSERARADRRRLTVTLAVAFGCPFEGAMSRAHVFSLAAELANQGIEEIVLADTIGVAVPTQVGQLVRAVDTLASVVGIHLHNTRNTGYANVVAAIDAGATVIDAAVGGTGGCPFAPRATGNIATEDLTYMLEGMGHATGLQLEALISTSHWLGEQLGQELPGLLQRAGDFVPEPLSA
jgi:hydroxymethylglutaryl-CoA lyase/(R)-citramalyl-CoA lyase